MARSVNPNTGIKGMDIVLGNLNKEIVKMKRNSKAGLLEAAAFIRRDMDKTFPKVPVDFGNLRASWFVTPFKSMGKDIVVLGFNANYALYVHEMVDGDFKSTRIRYSPKRKYTPREGAGPKFLEAALNRNKAVILGLITKEVILK